MVEPAHPPIIPAEALARRARLAATLAAMEGGSASLEPQPLLELRQHLNGQRAMTAESCLAALSAAGLIEEGLELLRQARRTGADPERIADVAVLIEGPAARAMARRGADWQLDSRRTTVRFAFAKEDEALDFDDGDLHAILLLAFRLEGFPLALDLGKRPRPMLRLELPLPAGAGGLEEWAEVVLRRDPPGQATTHLARLNERLPAGLRLTQWHLSPAFASPLFDLAEGASWRWTCPADLLGMARAAAADFLAAPEFIWAKGEGLKAARPLDLRPLLTALAWDGPVLHTSTRMDPRTGLNPLRLHAAVLGLEWADLRGLLRTAIRFRADQRLAQGERYEPKLKNMYEDAVLLSGGSNITLVDDEDDEPLRLG